MEGDGPSHIEGQVENLEDDMENDEFVEDTLGDIPKNDLPVLGPPRYMTILSWNCRRLGNQSTINALVDLIKEKRPKPVYKKWIFQLKRKLGFNSSFVVDSVGHSGSIILFWKNEDTVRLISWSKRHINDEMCGVGAVV